MNLTKQHVARIIAQVRNACSGFDEGTIDIPELQDTVHALASALDSTTPVALMKAFYEFDYELEGIRFLSEEHEQRQQVLQEVGKLLAVADKAGTT